MTLRTGITTGTCAAAAAKAAATLLAGGAAPDEVEVSLPAGKTIRAAIVFARASADGAAAAVRKDAGDDPDVTHGMEIVVAASWSGEPGVTFAAGEGVGTVTKPGLQIPPGQPAINPVPRRMIAAAVQAALGGEGARRGVRVEVSVPGGREAAPKTFNPRLGIEGGLSILGTTGIVRPYCGKAICDSLQCALDVAAACGVRAPALVPGNIGAKAAARHFPLRDQQCIEVGNAWGFALDRLAAAAFDAVLLVGHPGKLAKLAEGQWDTHWTHSRPAAEMVAQLHAETLGRPAAASPTVEGVFSALQPAEKILLADALAERIRLSVRRRICGRRGESDFPVAVLLVDMSGTRLGAAGDFCAMEMKVPHIFVVGCGPGAAEYLTDAARRAVAEADSLVGSRRLLALFAETARKSEQPLRGTLPRRWRPSKHASPPDGAWPS